jgi:hypothetical protein
LNFGIGYLDSENRDGVTIPGQTVCSLRCIQTFGFLFISAVDYHGPPDGRIFPSQSRSHRCHPRVGLYLSSCKVFLYTAVSRSHMFRAATEHSQSHWAGLTARLNVSRRSNLLGGKGQWTITKMFALISRSTMRSQRGAACVVSNILATLSVEPQRRCLSSENIDSK